MLTCLVGLGGIAYLTKGVYVGCTSPMGGWDLRIRQKEYLCFARRIYPNSHLVSAGKSPAKVHSLYPPYAFPLFSCFFGSGSFQAALFTIQMFSLMAISLMMWQGASVLEWFGPQAAAFGAVLAPACAGNCEGLAEGQFSMMCMGFITLQVFFLGRGRPLLAGLCWAISMIKPQIGLPFTLLFLVRREWLGLLAGSWALLLLSAFSLAWTNVKLWDLLQAFLKFEKLSFVMDDPYSASIWVQATRLDPRLAMGLALGLLLALSGFAVARDLRSRLSLLPAAGLCGACGYLLFYHRFYDGIVLYPLLLVMVQKCFKGGNILERVVTVLLALSLCLPQSSIAWVGMLRWLLFCAPVAASGVLVLHLVERTASARHPRLR